MFGIENLKVFEDRSEMPVIKLRENTSRNRAPMIYANGEKK